MDVQSSSSVANVPASATRMAASAEASPRSQLGLLAPVEDGHRKLLAETGGTSTSESELSEADSPHALEPVTEEDIENTVGFSIGYAQKRLTSPMTPASEKVAALNESRQDGFLADEPEDDEEIVVDNQDGFQRRGADGENRLPHKAKAESGGAHAKPAVLDEPESRKRTIRKALAHARTASDGRLNEFRFKKYLRRFSLAKSSTLASFQSKLSSFSSNQSLGRYVQNIHQENGKDEKQDGCCKASNTTKHDATADRDNVDATAVRDFESERRFRSKTLSALETKSRRNEGVPSAVALNQVYDDTLFTPLVSSEHLPPHTLRRTASDNSLYLQRTISIGASTLGDEEKWKNVQDQVNSRFKAITDSFQDASIVNIRLPRIPKVTLPSLPNFKADNRLAGGSIRILQSRISLAQTNTLPQRDGETDQTTQKVLAGESSSHPSLRRALAMLTGDVVVLGGYRGSILRSAQAPNRQLWIPIKVGLNVRKVNLEVGLNPEDEEKAEQTIIPSGMLTHIGPVDISRRLLRRMRKCKNAQMGVLRVWDWGYDWRLSPHLLSRQLIEFLEGLPSNQPGVLREARGVTVLAHSLGGLITRHAVNIRPELFAGVLYAGTPHAAVNILGPFRNGDDVLLSSRVLTAQVNFSMRTSFALLPEDGRCFFDKTTKEEYPIDFFDANTWFENRLSPCINPALPPLVQEYRKSILGAMTSSMPSIGRRSSLQKEKDKDTPSQTASKRGGEDGSPSAAAIVPQMSTDGSPRRDTNQNSSVATACTIPFPIAFEYLQRTLAEVKQFKQDLEFRASHAEANRYPPIAVLYGKTVPTVYGARVDGREGIKHADAYDDLAFASGDGVVLAREAMAPKGYRVVKGGKVSSGRSHATLLGDLEAVGKCLEALVEGRSKGLGLGNEAEATS